MRSEQLATTAPLDLARGLLRPEKGNPERPTALRNVEEYVADWAVPLTRRVLVELVEEDED